MTPSSPLDPTDDTRAARDTTRDDIPLETGGTADTGRHREPTQVDRSGEEAATVLHEERLVTGTELHETGRVRVRKHVDTHPVEETVSRSVEHADDPERVPAVEGDSGEVETLEDGSLSIPLFEEMLVVTKKLVVRERVIVRKRTVVDEHTLQTELRRERVSIDADDDTLIEDRRDLPGTTGADTGASAGGQADPDPRG